MTRRHSRAGMRDPEAFFESLRPARAACVQQLRDLPPNGPHYKMLQVIVAALDVGAAFFTDQRDFYILGRGDADRMTVSAGDR
ncbi:hypothetical protein [Caulobacter sp. 1776]|uniref:hypothetical protein n=1 Tax=Caulobacter sp. 1776 TaxID=3156420 RepID=UPI003398BC01